MRTLVNIAIALAAAGCGGSPPSLAPHPQGYAGRMENADVHEQLAQQHQQKAGAPDTVASLGNYQCGDRDMSDQLTSGGQRMLPVVPCWDPAEENAQHERSAAKREEHRARTERRSAAKLVEDELAECRGLSPAEISHSPFAHRAEISEIVPHREADAIRGVRILFKPVVGLTVAWMEQAIACHRAQYERLGEPPTYLSDDPTLVPGAKVTVSAHRGRVEVFIETRNDVSANVALARARDLIEPRTAVR